MRLFDAGSGDLVEVRPLHRGHLLVHVAADAGAPAAAARALVVADSVRRTAQGEGLRAAIVTTRTDGGVPAAAALRLNVVLGGHLHAGDDAADVLVTSAPGTDPPRQAAAHRVTVAGIRSGEEGGAASAAAVDAPDDPLSVRLALLMRHYRDPADLSPAALSAARSTLADWRERVAGWAEHPSRPMCAEYVADVRTAFEEDLDTPRAVDAMTRLAADGELPPGSKFEAFAHLDHLLGLDLARDVGRH
jgi:hypothetical protein